MILISKKKKNDEEIESDLVFSNIITYFNNSITMIHTSVDSNKCNSHY